MIDNVAEDYEDALEVIFCDQDPGEEDQGLHLLLAGEPNVAQGSA